MKLKETQPAPTLQDIKPKDLELEPWRIKAFVNNAQVALAPYVMEDRLEYLAEYGWHLNEVLRSAESIDTKEMAFLLVSVAYDLLFGDEDRKKGRKTR